MTNPVSENEMREFFNRLISTVVEGTRTHDQLNNLEARFKETETRVQSVTGELAQVRQELYTTVVERDKARSEASDHKALADIYRSERDKARSEAKDQYIRANDLQINLDTSHKELVQVTGQCDMWKTTAEHSTSDRDYWRNRALENETNYKKLEESYAELKEKHAKFGSFFKEMFDEGPAKLEHKEDTRQNILGNADPLASGASTTQEQDVGQGEPTSEYPSSQPSTSENIDPLPHFTPPGYEPLPETAAPSQPVEIGTQDTSPSQEPSRGEVDQKNGWHWNFDTHDYAYYVDGEVKENPHEEFFPDGRKNPAYIPF